MSDDFLDDDGDVAGAEETKPQGKRVGFLPAVVIQILKWVAIVLGGIVFIVTVVVITLNIMGPGSGPQTRVPFSPEYEQQALEELDWYGLVGELRGLTRDTPRQTFVIEPQLGYTRGNSAVQNNLINQLVPIKDMMLTWFSSQTADYLSNIENRVLIRQTLLAEINRILVNDIRDVRFTAYQILPF